MTTQLEYTNRLCIDGPHEGTFVRMHSTNVGATVSFPATGTKPPCLYELQEDGTLQSIGTKGVTTSEGHNG